MTADLVQFLRARLDEDEQAARAATPGPWVVDSENYAESISAGDGSVHVVSGGRWGGEASVFETTADAVHIARHDPARALAEVKAKRRRLARHTSERRRLALNDEGGTTSFAYLICTSCTPNRIIDTEGQEVVEWPCPDLLDDAAVYAAHPDYRPEWAPDPA